jgi:hypothetical protein
MASGDSILAPFGDGGVEQIFRHTVPIFNFDRRKPELAGTGVFIAVDHALLVITAADVFEPAFRHVAFGRLSDKGLQVFGAVDMPILLAKDQTDAGDAQRAVYKDGLDIAVIQPTADVLEAFAGHYHPFDLRSSLSCASTWAVVSGWPARKNVYNPRKRVGNFRTCYHIQCPVAEIETIRKVPWNTEVYIGLSADKAKDFVTATSGAPVHLPKLEGMSGSGVWMRSTAESPAADWSLCGILVEDHEAKRLLKVIKIEHVWAPLEQGWGLVK